jgi:glycosyltransferase involved in cell wall biosynthesis
MPTVATVQGLDFRREKWGPVATGALRVAAYAAGKVPTETIVVSRELQRHFRESYDTETTYIPNGVDLAELGAGTPVEGLAPDRYILFLGRLVPEKHVHTLIDAYRASNLDVPLAIAGPSSHSDEYVAALHRQAEGADGVVFLGPRYGEEKSWLLRNARAFVQPSSIEGLPIALLEALASGAFPIVSDIPENLEPVTTSQGRLGLNFPVGDVSALADRLRTVVDLPSRRDEAERLRAHVSETYDWPRIAEQTEAVYIEAVGAGRRRRFGRTSTSR